MSEITLYGIAKNKIYRGNDLCLNGAVIFTFSKNCTVYIQDDGRLEIISNKSRAFTKIKRQPFFK